MLNRNTKRVTSSEGQQPPEDVPPCPNCGALMDRYGLWFASKVLVEDAVYYCNNPLCNGGQHSVVDGQEAAIVAQGSSVS
jgi:hypothetical protein